MVDKLPVGAKRFSTGECRGKTKNRRKKLSNPPGKRQERKRETVKPRASGKMVKIGGKKGEKPMQRIEQRGQVNLGLKQAWCKRMEAQKAKKLKTPKGRQGQVKNGPAREGFTRGKKKARPPKKKG